MGPIVVKLVVVTALEATAVLAASALTDWRRWSVWTRLQLFYIRTFMRRWGMEAWT
jgi:hypothetical protein